MSVAAEHYAELGWAVDDVSGYRPYDLVCSQATREQHVEVKGSTGRFRRIELTRNEVTHARTCSCLTALAVVEDIELERGTPPVATGGRLRVFEPWVIEEDALEPLNYSYRLP